MIDSLGQHLGNYHLIRLLGTGGMASVYLAEHVHLGTQAAIKVLSPHLQGDNLERFLNGEPVEGLTPGLLPPLGRWARREPALVSRLATLVVVCALLQVNYHVANYRVPGSVTLWLHAVIMALLLMWLGVSFLFQKLLNAGRWPEDLPFAWAGADIFILSHGNQNGAIGKALSGEA